MSCSHCPHCKASAARSSLRLPDPPSNRGRAGVDVGFYTAFARAYDRARTLGPQPMRRLRDVNPWLTDSQCHSYLRRARALGLVQAPARAVVPQPVPDMKLPRQRGRSSAGGRRAAVSAEPAPELDLLDVVDDMALDNWTRKGSAVTVDMVVRSATVKLSEQRAQQLVADAIRAGFVDPDPRIAGAFRMPRD